MGDSCYKMIGWPGQEKENETTFQDILIELF